MNNHVLSILAENQSGVMSRVIGLISQRGYNIESMTAGVTMDPSISRMTLAITCDDRHIVQIMRQVEKLIPVINVTELHQNDSVYREIVLVKIKASASNRTDVVSIVDIFRSNIIDVSMDSITVELTGDESKIRAFTELVNQFGIIEIARTGLTGLKRGC